MSRVLILRKDDTDILVALGLLPPVGEAEGVL